MTNHIIEIRDYSKHPYEIQVIHYFDSFIKAYRYKDYWNLNIKDNRQRLYAAGPYCQ